MIGGVNDTDRDADAMADLLAGSLAHVNLIPMNPVAHTPWSASPMPVIERFAGRLRAAGLRDDHPAQPRPGGRGSLWPARREPRRQPTPARRSPAAEACSRRSSAAALRGERTSSRSPLGVEA